MAAKIICQVTTEEEKEKENEFQQLLADFPEILNPSFKEKRNKHRVYHYIPTSGPPVFAKPRRLDEEKLRSAKRYFQEMEELGIIRRSSSAWASPLHVVPKADGSLRPCGDYRRLNQATQDDRYPLPHIHAFNSRLKGAGIFSKIDLQKGYHQIPMAKEDIPKTAIITPFGLFEFLRMPFGLKNAAQAFQRLPSSLGEESSTKERTITESLPSERSEAKITQPLKRGRPTKAVQEQRAEEHRDERARLDLEERERQRNYDAEFSPISTRSGRMSRQRVRL